MHNLFSKNFFSIAFAIFLLTLFFAPSSALAQAEAQKGALEGLQQTAQQAGLAKNIKDTPASPAVFIGNLIGYALTALGVILVGLLLYGGYLWMTARGESDRVEKAKDTIINAVIGIVIIVLAYAITNFVLSRLIAAAQ